MPTGVVTGAGPWKIMLTYRGIKKDTILSNNDDCWKFPTFPFFFVGVISKMNFRRRPFNQKPLVFRKNPKTHLDVQGSFGDEGTFQECHKSWTLKIPLFTETENWRPGVYFDAEYLSAQFCRVTTPWIAIWAKILFFARKFIFSAFPLQDPFFVP